MTLPLDSNTFTCSSFSFHLWVGVSWSGCGLCAFCFTKSSYFQENQLSTVFHLAKRKWERFTTKDSSFLIVFFRCADCRYSYCRRILSCQSSFSECIKYKAHQQHTQWENGGLFNAFLRIARHRQTSSETGIGLGEPVVTYGETGRKTGIHR